MQKSRLPAIFSYPFDTSIIIIFVDETPLIHWIQGTFTLWENPCFPVEFPRKDHGSTEAPCRSPCYAASASWMRTWRRRRACRKGGHSHGEMGSQERSQFGNGEFSLSKLIDIRVYAYIYNVCICIYTYIECMYI